MAELAEHSNDHDITEEQVAHFLKSHSGFFLKHDDLLVDLTLAHDSGHAVSLLERQVSLLRERNVDMRDRLNSLLDSAKTNGHLFEKTKQLVLALIDAQSLDAIVNTFNRSLLSDFVVDFSSMTLFGDAAQHDSTLSRMVPVDTAYATIPGLLKSNGTTAGVLRPEELQFLFSEQADQISSAAVVALNHTKPLGVLAIGSKDPDHFSSDMGTLFLDYIAEVLNRILPQHLQP